ncbi:hypothetical protein Ae706Ps2_6241 [Pseudonocardia sp. Ae706_Ps2]|nr:hypothetical protein Ae706Ps2_6241 [Pseudonocardia sp. Ae706_Ps2]
MARGADGRGRVPAVLCRVRLPWAQFGLWIFLMGGVAVGYERSRASGSGSSDRQPSRQSSARRVPDRWAGSGSGRGPWGPSPAGGVERSYFCRSCKLTAVGISVPTGWYLLERSPGGGGRHLRLGMYCSLACVLSAAEDLKLGEKEHAGRLGTPADAERDRARILERAETMIRRGMSAKAAADVLQVPPAALRTWLKAAGVAVVPDSAESAAESVGSAASRAAVTPVFAAPGSVPPPAAGTGRAGAGAVQAAAASQVGPGAGHSADVTAGVTAGVVSGSGSARGEGSGVGGGSTGPGQRKPTGPKGSGGKGAGGKGADGKAGGVPGGVKPGQDPVLGKYTSPRALLHHWRQVERITDLEIGAVPAGVGKSGHPQGFAATVSARLLVGDAAGEVVTCTATEGAKMKACDVAAYAVAKILRPIMDAAAVAAAAAPPAAAPPAVSAGAAASAPPASARPAPGRPASALVPESGRRGGVAGGAGPDHASPQPAGGPAATGPAGGGVDARVVREWARVNGYVVGERGRIPAQVRAAYLAAAAGSVPGR